MITFLFRSFVGAALPALVLMAVCRGAESVGPTSQTLVHSVLVRDADVLATDSVSMYRATKVDKIWQRLPTPATMPLNGEFVIPAPQARRVFFQAARPEGLIVIDDTKTGASHQVSGDEARDWPSQEHYGLYGAERDGVAWTLVSDAYDFKHVLQAADGALYAIAAERKDGQWRDRIIRSADEGKSWTDISNNAMGLGLGVARDLLPDPDHPNLVCLLFQGRRGYVAQAQDEQFQWHPQAEGAWRQQHQTAADFFASNFSFGGIENISDYDFLATFGNYFSFPFGNRTSLDSFELTVEGERYEFAQAGAKEVTATLRFRHEDHEAAILDLKNATDFWGLKIEDAGGLRTAVRPVAEERAFATNGNAAYEQVRKNYEQKPGLLKLGLIAGKPYVRKVDLARLYTFPKPGVYKVQLTYACPFWAGPGRTHWTGSFGGPMITVTIK